MSKGCWKLPENVPEGYLTLHEYANKYGVKDSTVRARVRNGIAEGVKIGSRVFIKDKPFTRYSCIHFAHARNIPEGYLTVKQVAEKFHITHYAVQQWIQRGKIDYIKCGYFVYIPENAEPHVHNVTKSTQKPKPNLIPAIDIDGYKTIREMAEVWNMNINTARVHVYYGSVPSILFKNRRYIPENTPKPSRNSQEKTNVV